MRYINKARSLLVDSVILDLGNPILIEAKEDARKNVVAALKEGGFGSREVVVRVNDIDSPSGFIRVPPQIREVRAKGRSSAA